VELSGYLAVARRWWWTLLVATWVAAISGYVVASQIPPTYEAETQLLVGPYNTDRDTLAAAGDLVQTYSELVTTTPLLESAISETGATITADELRQATRVTANDTTRFLSIRVQGTDPEMAAQLANRMADEISLLASRGTNRPEGQLQVVDFAVAPTEPVAPQKSLIVGLAAIAALIGAMVLVMLVEYLSATVRTQDELERLTDLPFLGHVDTTRSLPTSNRGLVDQAPESAAAAAYRLIVAKVAFRDRAHPTRSLVVVGTGSDSTTGQIAANLAAITARSGRRAILVDADTTDATATRIFGLGDRSGLSDLFMDPDSDPADRLVRISSTLWVIPRGTASEGDVVDVDRAATMLDRLGEQADLVVVSTGPTHLSAGALVWAQAADAVVVTAARDQARRDDVEYAAETLRLVGANAVGTVFAERRRAILRGRPQAQPPVDRARPSAYSPPRHQPTLRERLEPEPPALEYEEIGAAEPPVGRRTTRRRGRPGERGV
jgi:capsular polysaccharide biosynthesis protein